nr:MFS transporter [Pseudomonas tremae]
MKPATATFGDASASFIEKGTAEFMRTALALFAGGFATFALLYCVQPLMPILSHDFSLNAAQASLSLSISTGLMAIGMLVTGPISDAVGRKPVMVAALFSAALCTLLSAVVPTWTEILIMRALVGLSLSGLAAVGMTYLGEEIHPKHTGLAMGLYIAGNAVGGMSGRLISGVLVDFTTWRVAVLIIGGIALASAILFAKFLPASRNFRPIRLNPKALIDGFSVHFKDAGLPWLFLEAFLLMGCFVTMFNYIGYRLLAEPYYMSQALVGLLSAAYLAGIYSSAKVGSLADEYGRRSMFMVSILVMAAGLGLTMASPVAMILPGMVVFTFGFFGAHSVASSWIGRRTVRAKGQASSLYLFSYYVGSSVVGSLGGFAYHAGGWNGVGAFMGAFLLAALLVAFKLKKLPTTATDLA